MQALDHVAQLAHVAGPVHVLQVCHGLRSHALDGAIQLTQKVVDQQRDVVAAVVQRRNLNDNHAQAVVQIFAEPPRGNLCLEVFVGRRKNPHVHRDGLAAAYRSNAVFLQRAQHFGLGR